MKILLTGAMGQVGSALLHELAALGEIVACSHSDLDVANATQVRERVRRERPSVIVNCAAYNNVDRAESEPGPAHEVNAAGPGILAEEAHAAGALLIHYSTDYVFDGAAGRPYIEADAPNPLSVYGRSKVEGEVLVRAAGGRHIILRTSWVYAENAQNFLMTVLNKAARGETLRVVSDQISAPTWAADLARLTRALLEHPEAPLGTWHAAATGETSRYAYAAEVLRLTGIDTELLPAQSQEFPGAIRPAYSALDSRALPRESGIRAIGPWKERLAAFLASVGRAKAPA